MKQQISLREANQHLSRYIEAVERGEEIIITRRGKPVARLAPVASKAGISPERLAAWKRLKAMARPLNIGRFDRDEAHER